jgi:hydrogenase nickel incorporation protein HypA/HybF
MHESSLAREVLKLALARAAESRAGRVRVVRGWISETESLSPDGIRFHFAAHARGTPAEGAELELRLIHVEARCDACRRVYTPEHHLLLCPHCGATGGELLGQTGLGIETLEVEER